MRNLKRALSMAMASVMLMGMSVVGTSAASVSDFSDVDSINNKEAVAIATGLGIFDGYDDGSFKPEKVVTRAEMAVVIAKILHGADVDPSTFVGDSKFTDVPAWAEGYVNLVAAMGIIEGYGDGKFGPNDPVTTVQANIMLLKALGYYTAEGDNLPANWADAQLQATSKATALGFFGDKALKMDAGLTREDVAELTFNALFAQRVAYDDVRGLHVKSNDRNVVVTNGTVDETNTLAQNTFGLYAVDGIVTDNSYTNSTLRSSYNDAALTTVEFDGLQDLDKDGKADTEEYDFEIETGLDFIGHSVKVYYTIEKKAPVVFAMVDQATLVGEIYAGTSAEIAKAANDLGFKKNTVMSVIDAGDTINNYDMDALTLASGAVVGTGDKLVVISNSLNNQVDYVIRVRQYLDVVDEIDVDVDDGQITYTLEDEGSNGTNATDPVNTLALTEVEEDQYVIVTKIGENTDMVLFEAADGLKANITDLIANSTNAGATLKTVVADGENYSNSPVISNTVTDYTDFAAITELGEKTLILDKAGKLIGLANAAKKDIGYAYVAQFGTDHVRTSDDLLMKDVLTALIYFADGTKAVKVVDLKPVRDAAQNMNKAKSTDMELVNALTATDITAGSNANDAGIGDQITANYSTLNVAANGATPGYGIYYIIENTDGTVRLVDIEDMDTADVTYTDETGVYENKVVVTKKHSLQMDGSATPVTNLQATAGNAAGDKRMYANKDTVFFYVNGTYGTDLTVVPVVGIANVTGFDAADAGVSVPEVWVKQTITAGTDVRNTVEAMLVNGVYTQMSGVYYYNQNQFTVKQVAENNYSITYRLHDQKGEESAITYDGYTTSEKAYAAGRSVRSGYYVIRDNKLDALTGTSVFGNTPAKPTTSLTTDEVRVGNDVYCVDAVATYDEYNKNFYAVIGGNNTYGIVMDEEDVVEVIDLTGHNINTVAKLKAASAKHTIGVSYNYGENYEAGIIYVTSYVAGAVVGPTTTQGTFALTAGAYVEIGGSKYYVTTAYKGINDAVANAEVYNLGMTNAVVAIDVDDTAATLKGDMALAANRNSVAGAAGALNATGSYAGDTVTLADGNYIVVEVEVSGDVGYVVIEVVK